MNRIPPTATPQHAALVAIAALAALVALATTPAAAQLVPQHSGTDAEFRSLHAPSPQVVWTGGRGGRYAVTTDGGTSWRADSVRGAAELFFTGAWARDARTAWLLGTHFDGGLARIYRTDDGGASWTVQWESTAEGVFMDALQCWTADRCIAYGDPIDGVLMMLRTTDGRTWSRVTALPALIEGEAGFAASGTTLTMHGTSHAWIGTGVGARARVYRTSDGGTSWSVFDTPLPGNASSGIFGVAFRDTARGVAVGGDYQRRTEEQNNVVRTTDGGRTWTQVGAARPFGVRYGAAYSPLNLPAPTGGVTAATAAQVRALLAVGPSGAGVSYDDGASWTPLDTTAWNTVAFASNGDAWVAGTDGRIAKIAAAALAAHNAAGPPSGAPPSGAPPSGAPPTSAPPTGAPPAARDAPAQQRYPTRFDAQLTRQPVVRDALAWLDSNFEAQVAEWIRITEIPGTSRHEQQRAAYVKAQLEAEGLVVTIDSIGNVTAVRPGTGGGETVVFAAHMDTVHPLDTDVTVTLDSADVGGRRARVLRAPGIFDNSASVSNMLAMARALNRANVRTRGDIVFIATAQEELGLLGMDYWLEHNPGVADVLVGLDGGLPNINYGALGIYWTKYSFRGEGSHTNTSAGRPHPARALADAVRAIYEIEIPDYMGGAVYNVGMLAGGKIYNAIPEEVSFTMDLRSVNPILLSDLDAQIDSAVAQAARTHRVEWSKQQALRNRAGGTAQMLEDRLTHPLIQTALDVHRHFDIESRAIATGSTDANAAVVRGIPAISIGRSIGGDQHTLSEWSEVDSALPATKIALLIAIMMAGLSVPGS